MDVLSFLIALKRHTPYTSTHRDPLAAAERFLDEHRDTAEGQALRKVVKALAIKEGEFSESEIWLFSTETITLVTALHDARVEGRYPELDWWAVLTSGQPH